MLQHTITLRLSSKEESLLKVLTDEIQRTLMIILEREPIQHRELEGRVVFEFPSPLSRNQNVTVKVESYLMSDFDLSTSWSYSTLEKCLEHAILNVRKWYCLEKDSCSHIDEHRIF